jgi:hypothetical protein
VTGNSRWPGRRCFSLGRYKLRGSITHPM